MIANDSGEVAVVVESNGILYEAIIDPLFLVVEKVTIIERL